MKTYHVKKDDKVLVNAGNYRGSEATVKAVLAAKDRVVLEISGDAAHKLGKRHSRRAVGHIERKRPLGLFQITTATHNATKRCHKRNYFF